MSKLTYSLRAGKNISFFSAALTFWLLFRQGKSDKIIMEIK
jgi:hypothetical protein